MTRESFTFTAIVLAALATAAPLAAQRLYDARSAVFRRDTIPTSPTAWRTESIAPPSAQQSTPRMVVSGVLLGAVGMFAGGAVGYGVETSGGCVDEFCGLGGALLGGLVGETIGLATGVHLAGGKRGSLGAEIGGSFLFALLGVLVAIPTQGVGLLAIPPLQLWLTIRLEKAGARRGTSVQ